eukprot:6551453-Prymnesium_polylepis.1
MVDEAACTVAVAEVPPALTCQPDALQTEQHAAFVQVWNAAVSGSSPSLQNCRYVDLWLMASTEHSSSEVAATGTASVHMKPETRTKYGGGGGGGGRRGGSSGGGEAGGDEGGTGGSGGHD